MKGMKLVVFLAVTAFLLGIIADYSRAADTKRKEQTKVNMDSNLKKKLNTFFSNFSEVSVEPFTRDKIDNKELIRFGVWHNYKNRFGRFKYVGDGVLQLKATHVKAAVEKYFGRKLTKHESGLHTSGIKADITIFRVPTVKV